MPDYDYIAKLPHGNRVPIETRLLRAIEIQPNGCWLFTGWLGKDGYGYMKVGDKKKFVHRLSYETFRGSIPKGHEIDHICHNPKTCNLGKLCPHRRCINPDHLEPCLYAENHSAERANRSRNLSIINGSKTHCPKGHPYDALNTRVYGTSRSCRECSNRYSKARARQRRAQVKEQAITDLQWELTKLALGPWLNRPLA